MTQREPYKTDLTDEEWRVLGPIVPDPPEWGRPLEYEMREIINTILYVLRTGCQWEMTPHDLVPGKSAYYHFSKWRDDGTWERISVKLHEMEREHIGRDPKPTAAIADSQSVPTATSGPQRGYDGGKKVKGRKRHLLVDTEGLVIALLVSGADIHDADAAKTLMESHPDELSDIEVIWADSKYSQKGLPEWVSDNLDARIEVKMRPTDAEGFAVIKRRWVVERTNAWQMNNRRLQRDVEVLPSSSEAMMHVAQIDILLRRLVERPSRLT